MVVITPLSSCNKLLSDINLYLTSSFGFEFHRYIEKTASINHHRVTINPTSRFERTGKIGVMFRYRRHLECNTSKSHESIRPLEAPVVSINDRAEQLHAPRVCTDWERPTSTQYHNVRLYCESCHHHYVTILKETTSYSVSSEIRTLLSAFQQQRGSHNMMPTRDDIGRLF